VTESKPKDAARSVSSSGGGARSLGRILDANGNRIAEGLRALEEIARFLLDDVTLAGRCKTIRHQIRGLIPAQAVAHRDTAGDVGVAYQSGEAPRGGVVAHLRANAARVQEALRAAEEAARLGGLAAAAGFERARYDSYGLELMLLSRIPAWRLWQIRLYVLVDTTLCSDPVATAAAAVRGGAGVVQLRAKGLSQRDYRDLAARVADAVRSGGGFFVVNDHVAVAAALGADGIHVGQHDLALGDVRRVVGPLCAIGASCHTPAQLIAAQDEGADYVGLGPMYATTTKPHEPCRGPELLDAVRGDLRVPSFAIGGLDLHRAVELLPRLPHGLAVAGAMCRAENPELAAAALTDVLEREDRVLTRDGQ
jgi:thiamine-phosphate pyrophosphorylase